MNLWYLTKIPCLFLWKICNLGIWWWRWRVVNMRYRSLAHRLLSTAIRLIMFRHFHAVQWLIQRVVCLCPCVCGSLSLWVSLWVCVWVSLSVSMSVFLYVSLSVCDCVSVTVCMSVCVWVSVTRYVSLRVCMCLCHQVFLYVRCSVPENYRT